MADGYYLTPADRKEFDTLAQERRGRQRVGQTAQRRRRMGGPGSGGSTTTTRTSEVVGEMALSLGNIDGIVAVDFETLEDSIKEQIDPDGLLELADSPRVFRLGSSVAHRYAIIRVNEASDSEAAVFSYYAVPQYEPLESGSGSGEPTPMLSLVINMSQDIPLGHLLQMKTVGNPASSASPEDGGSLESGGSEGGFGDTSGFGSQSPYSPASSMIAGVVDVMSCAPAPLPESGSGS